MGVKDSIRVAGLCSILGVCGAAADPLELGKRIPRVEAQTHDGATVKLHETAAKGWTLVYFYPKASTPGCTKQACSLRDANAALTEHGVRVFGVSRDSVAKQKAFAEAQGLPFLLVADVDGTVVKAFGVPGMGLTRLPSRQAFLFRDGVLVWRDLKASTTKQAADVLEAIRAAGG